jgi:hypothetical protein
MGRFITSLGRDDTPPHAAEPGLVASALLRRERQIGVWQSRSGHPIVQRSSYRASCQALESWLVGTATGSPLAFTPGPFRDVLRTPWTRGVKASSERRSTDGVIGCVQSAATWSVLTAATAARIGPCERCRLVYRRCAGSWMEQRQRARVGTRPVTRSACLAQELRLP